MRSNESVNEDSYPIGKEPCPTCGSRDNLARYSDGHAYCFTPGCDHYEKGDGVTQDQTTTRRKPDTLPLGEYKALKSRKISEETCRRWGYHIARWKNQTVQVADIKDEKGSVAAQKVRTPDKEFVILGDVSGIHFYGKWLAQDGGKRIIITEGEIDALTIHESLSHRWPVVSPIRGAGSLKKACAAELPWLSKFEEVVICFDQDEPGQDAVDEIAGMFPPGKLKLVTLPLKDANEMVQAGRRDELVRALWAAQEHRPDGIVTVADVFDEVLKAPEEGMPWFVDELNDTTFGRRLGEAVALGAGTGVGKTTFITQQIAADLEAGHQVGIFAFEQSPPETVKRVAGISAGKTFHIPDSGWEDNDLQEALEKLRDGPKLHLYDHFGSCDWEVVKSRMRFLAHSHGVKIFYLDHLTALAAAEDDERKALEKIMAEVGGLVKELDCWLLFVSHLATPEGKPHEEGGRVMIRHFKGSRAIGFWSHFMLGIERAQQDEDEGHMSKLRVLKDRYTGRATGQTFTLDYEHETGKFVAGKSSNMFDNDEDNF